MAENLHDTPATYEQNLEYLRDPDKPEAKPYSTRQKAANEENKNWCTLYHKIHAPGNNGGRDFRREDVEQAMEDGWQDSPILHPNDPAVTAVAVKQPMTPERELLLAEATKLGLHPADTWPIEQLRQAVVEAASKPAQPAAETSAKPATAAKQPARKPAAKKAAAG